VTGPGENSDTAPKATPRHHHHCRLCSRWLTSAEAMEEHIRRTHRVDGGLFHNAAWEPGVCGWCGQPVLPWQIGDHLRHGRAFGAGGASGWIHHCPDHGEVTFVSKRIAGVVTDHRSTPFDREIAEARQGIADGAPGQDGFGPDAGAAS
jgi:hypothetical protein